MAVRSSRRAAKRVVTASPSRSGAGFVPCVSISRSVAGATSAEFSAAASGRPARCSCSSPPRGGTALASASRFLKPWATRSSATACAAGSRRSSTGRPSAPHRYRDRGFDRPRPVPARPNSPRYARPSWAGSWQVTRLLVGIARCEPYTSGWCSHRCCRPRAGSCPTCSEYAAAAIEKHGPFRGVFLAVRRIVRCAPWHPGGFDPVP